MFLKSALRKIQQPTQVTHPHVSLLFPQGVTPSTSFLVETELRSFSSLFMEDRLSFSCKDLQCSPPPLPRQGGSLLSLSAEEAEIKVDGLDQHLLWRGRDAPSLVHSNYRERNQPMGEFPLPLLLWPLQSRCLAQSQSYQKQISTSSAAV